VTTAPDSAPARLAAAGLTAPAVLWLVAGLLMLQPLATDLYLPTLPGIATHFGADVARVQWTLSIFIAVFGAWQLVAGPLSDRFGRLPVVLAGACTYGVASVVCMLAPSVEVLIAGRALQALGACSCLVAARAIVRDLYAPAAGARLLASASTIMGFAPLLGPIIGAQLYLAFGWRSAFALLAAFSLVLLAAAATRLRETNVARNPHALRLAPMLRTYARVAAAPTFRAYALAATASYAGLFAFISGSPFVLIRVLGQSTTAFSVSFATMVTGYLLGAVLCRRMVVRHGLQRTVYAGAALQAAAGLAMAALALAGIHQAIAIVAPGFVFGLSHGLIQPPAQSGAVAPFPASAGAAAAAMGFMMMLVATCIGVWIGASYDGTVYPLTLTIGATSLVSAAIAFVLVRRHGDVAHHG
jgi:DHA1 family bicyclomycin/chloramphenicol resistance-like MFS transporter